MTLLIVTATVALACAVLPAAGQGASATTSIATAPVIEYGALQTGGSKSEEFLRLSAFAGDQITFRVDQAKADGSIGPVFQLYDPSVDDYTINRASSLDQHDMMALLKDQFVWTVPFTGLGTIGIRGGNGAWHDTFTLVATVAHATAATAPTFPSMVELASSTIDVRVSVVSPAGVPTGQCELDRRSAGGNLAFVSVAPVTGGLCAFTTTPELARTSAFTVKFLPDPGWLPASAELGPVRVQRLPVTLRFLSLPASVSSSRSRVSVVVRVQAPRRAGKPSGACVFTRVARSHRTRVGMSRTRHGVCRLRTRAGLDRRTRFAVAFRPDSGWLGASALSRSVAVLHR